MLGFKSWHYPTKLSQFEEYDALADITVLPIYKFLDSAYSGSKFILTVRDVDSWIRSCRKHFEKDVDGNSTLGKFRRIVYGTTVFDEQKFWQTYHEHLADVHAYFANRPQDLLELNICAGEGWQKLCSFLGKDVPAENFPFENRTNYGVVKTS